MLSSKCNCFVERGDPRAILVRKWALCLWQKSLTQTESPQLGSALPALFVALYMFPVYFAMKSQSLYLS